MKNGNLHCHCVQMLPPKPNLLDHLNSLQQPVANKQPSPNDLMN